jgi:pimeloyl-ACP methyl ester carboxylesterase
MNSAPPGLTREGSGKRNLLADGYVDTNGVRLWYEVRGRPDGAPVVLVMGVAASALWWPPELVDALVEAGHRVVRFDNLDIGLSSHVDYERAPYDLDDMASDAIGLLDALGIERAHLVGASFGGMISQVLALSHPERVRSLALISSTPGPDDRLSPPTDEFMAFVTRPADPDQDPVEATVAFCGVVAGSRVPFDEPHYRQLVTADLARGTNTSSNHGRVPVSATSRVHDLRDVRVPTIVVHGTEDPLFPIDHAVVLADAIPGSRLVKWDGVGHELPPPLVPELAQLLTDHTRGTAGAAS